MGASRVGYRRLGPRHWQRMVDTKVAGIADGGDDRLSSACTASRRVLPCSEVSKQGVEAMSTKEGEEGNEEQRDSGRRGEMCKKSTREA